MQVKVHFEGRATLFHVENPKDHIQSFHARGSFYEVRQLLLHRDMIPMRSTVLDIGANVGNHTLFYAMHTSASRVYPFEPNPVAHRLLELNISINSNCRATIDTRHSHFGIARAVGSAQPDQADINNLGGTRLRLLANADGDTIECVPLDQLDFEGRIGFIKIDVEGMEIDVFAGAVKTIDKFRPIIAVEVSERNEPDFWRWLRHTKYEIISLFYDYFGVKTYVAIPIC